MRGIMKIITDERCVEYSRPGHPERPQRIKGTLEKLRSQKELNIEWLEPLPVGDEIILRAHDAVLLKSLDHPTEDFDADTPAYPNIRAYARRSVGGALRALKAARDKQMAFSLLRPPGHHATRNHAMGFCFLNSIAIAVLEALATGFNRVAVFDFDVHHGNGTEAILLDNPRCAFFSVHQYPAYPGTGAESFKNAHNYTVAPGAPRETYQNALRKALADVRDYKPDLIAVSAGFDAYRRDPLSNAALEADDFRWLGKSVREFGVPAFSVLEGGYSSELPELIFSYLLGLSGRAE